jgi:aryl-alcohol dehydrogenase-like predicted oxidoreductase
MKYNRLGRTGLLVSEICFGTMTFSGKGFWKVVGTQPQEVADSLVVKALDAGINFFDTANVYSEGESEKMLGKALGSRRKDVVVATKVRGRMGPGPNETGLSRAHIIAEAEASLRRLGTDYIDLYQIHGFDPIAPLEETLRALDDLVRSGKVRYIGCSNLAAWHLAKSLWIADRLNLHRFETVQAYYTLAGRDLEREVVPLMEDQQLGLLVWSPLAGGLLSGKYARDKEGPKDARRANFDFPPVDAERAFDVVDVLRDMSKEKNATVSQLAISWLLHQNAVTSVIIGAKKEEQMEENLAAPDVRLTKEEIERLNEVSALPREYPGWMVSFQAQNRYPET